MSTTDSPRPKYSRRAMLSLIGMTLTGACSLPLFDHVSAESLREARVRGKVNQLIESRARAMKLQERLGMGAGSDSKAQLSADEVYAVRQYTPVWLSPAVDALRDIANSDVDVGPRIDVASRALAVHLVELSDECDKASRSGCARELDEYVATISDVLRKEGLARFVKGRRWDGNSWVDS